MNCKSPSFHIQGGLSSLEVGARSCKRSSDKHLSEEEDEKLGLKEEEGSLGEGERAWRRSLLAFNSVENKRGEVLISLNQQLHIESVI